MLNHAFTLLQQQSIEMKAIFAAAGYKRRSYWKNTLDGAVFPYRFLPDINLQIGSEKLFTIGYSIPRILREECPQVVVSAGFSSTSLFASSFCRRQSIPFIIHSGETARQAKRRRLEWLRKSVRQVLLNQCERCIAYGQESKAFLLGYGLRNEQIDIAINSVDTDQFLNRIASIPLKDISHNKGERPRMLFVGNLQKLKGVEFVLRALHILQREKQKGPSFNIIGDGPDRERLEALTKALSLRDIYFLGALSHDDILPFYANSDFFIFPSLYDIFGLVMVEAAAAGLPIIASKFAGGTIDIIEDGVNGIVSDPRDIVRLARNIQELCQNASRREQMALSAKRVVVDRVNIRKTAVGFSESILKVLQ